MVDLVERGSDVAAIIGAMRHAVIVVDAGRSIAHMNVAAVQLLDAADGLRIRAGCLEASRKQADSDLLRALGRGGIAACGRAGGKWPYIVRVVPLPDGYRLVLVVDPDQMHCPTTELIRGIFGMTQAEAEIAVRVVAGAGLKPISEDLNLSLATVKTHLQHVFDKTHTHRQAELVRLLLAVVP